MHDTFFYVPEVSYNLVYVVPYPQSTLPGLKSVRLSAPNPICESKFFNSGRSCEREEANFVRCARSPGPPREGNRRVRWMREVLVGWSLFSCTQHRSSLNFSIVEPRVRNRRNSRESFSSSLPRAPAVHTPMCAFFPRTGNAGEKTNFKASHFSPVRGISPRCISKLSRPRERGLQ